MKKLTHFVIACVLGFACMQNAFAQNGADVLLGSGPCDPIIPLFCSSGVENPGNAVDDDISSFARMKTELGLLSTSWLEVGFSNPAPQGSWVAFFVENTAALNLDLINSVRMYLYNANDALIASKDIFTLADVDIDESGRALLKLRVPKNESATKARIELGGLLTLSNKLDVYGAVHAPSQQSVYADYIYDGGPCHPVTFECNSGVLNAEQAIDADRTNYAGLVIPLGINDNAFLDLGFSVPGPAGSTVSWTLGTNGTLIGASLLSRLRLVLYDADGNVIRTKKGLSLAEIELIGTYQFKVKIKAPNTPGVEVARARIYMTSLLGVASEMLIYHVSYTPKINFASYFKETGPVEQNSLTIYPNPASTQITVLSDAAADEQLLISVFNAEGKIVLNREFNASTSNSIDIGMLPDGLYILNAASQNKSWSQTFIVDR